MQEEILWWKILGTAMVSSLLTAVITEPIKLWMQRRRVRKALYAEIAHNVATLHQSVECVDRGFVWPHNFAAEFKERYRKLAYDLAQKDANAFYAIGPEERYSIRTLYCGFDVVAESAFADDDSRISYGVMLIDGFLIDLKLRKFSQRLVFAASGKEQKDYFRRILPMTDHEVNPSSISTKLLRKWDEFQYWRWQRGKKNETIAPSFIS